MGSPCRVHSLFAGTTLVVLLSSSTLLQAQYRAGLQGSVTDPTGAAVPGANVTLRNPATNLERKVTANEQGVYFFDRLAPGNYALSVEASGFKRTSLENVSIAAEQLQGLNVTLEVGAVSDTITVTAESSMALQTESAAIDGTISNERILRLPQSGRDPYETVRLAPGIFGLGARSGGGGAVNFPNNAGPGGSSVANSIFQTENQVPISANGQRITGNNFELDGVAVNSQAWGGAAVLTPNQESVKQVRVVSSNYTAENGRNTGALIQVVSQNGSNEFHGSFVTKFNRPELNAFARWGGPFNAAPQKVLTNLTQYAGSVGGPIWRDKLFFFFSYETIRNSTGSIDSIWAETPEYADLIQRARPGGIATQIVNFPGMRHNVQQTLQRDCASVSLSSTQCATLGNGIDIGSPMGAIGQRVATPLGGGLDGIADLRYIQVLSPANNTAQQFNGRLDYQLSSQDLVVFSLFYTPNDNTTLSNRRPAQQFLSARRNTAGALSWTRTLTPTMLNEARFNVTRWFFDEINSNTELPWGIPEVRVADNPFNFDVRFGVGGAGVFYQTTYNFRDIVTKVVGSHNLKFGVDINREQNNDTVAWAARPSYNFGNLWNFANDAAIDESGNFDPRNGFPTDLKKYIRNGIYSLFVQDDWKVRRNLTLNMGLRWEYFTPNREKFDNIANLELGPNRLTDARIVIGGSQWEPDRNNFGPQIGFAWSPDSAFGREFKNRLVVRGGFGVGFNRIPLALSLDSRLNPPFFGQFNLTGDNIVYSLGNEINSFYGWPSNPATILRFNENNIPTTGAPVNVFATPRNLRQPYSLRYSFELQYDLGGSWLASVGYQGSGGRKLPRRFNFNLFSEPNPRLNQVTYLQNDVSSNFNAMLLRVQRRFSRGFDLSAQYRWSKSIDTCSNDNNCPQSYPFDIRTERGPSDFDSTHSFVTSGLLDLPIFRNKATWTGRLLGGWQLNGIVTATSGFPWTPVFRSGDCGSIQSRGGLCPLRPTGFQGIPGYSTDNSAFQNGTNFGPNPAQYFTEPPVPGILPGNRADVARIYPGIGRNVFRGPSYFNVDASLVKRMSLPALPILGENAGVDLRANFFNLFNQLNLESFGYDSGSTQVNNAGNFGRSGNALAGRIVEFQLRFSF